MSNLLRGSSIRSIIFPIIILSLLGLLGYNYTNGNLSNILSIDNLKHTINSSRFLNSKGSLKSHLKVTWSDCSQPGSHGKLSKVVFDPPVPELGQSFKVQGFGSIDENVTSGNFNVKVSAGWLSNTYSGPVCGDTVITFPFGAAKATLHGLTCPAKAGKVGVSAEVYLSSFMPVSSASMRAESTDENGNALICLDVKLEIVTVEASDIDLKKDHTNTKLGAGIHEVGKDEEIFI